MSQPWRELHALVEAMLDLLEKEVDNGRKLDFLIHKPTGFLFHQRGNHHMNPTLAGLAPGASGTITATPVDSTGASTTLPTGIVPVWTFSNPAFSFTPSTDGLSVFVSVPALTTADPTATVTLAYPDGSIKSTVAFPIDAAATPPVSTVAGFTFVQS